MQAATIAVIAALLMLIAWLLLNRGVMPASMRFSEQMKVRVALGAWGGLSGVASVLDIIRSVLARRESGLFTTQNSLTFWLTVFGGVVGGLWHLAYDVRILQHSGHAGFTNGGDLMIVLLPGTGTAIEQGRSVRRYCFVAVAAGLLFAVFTVLGSLDSTRMSNS